MEKRSFAHWLILGLLLVSSVYAAADIKLDMADSPDPVVKGQSLIYNITATNIGDADAFNITINNSYDAGVTFDSATFGPNVSNDTFIISNISAGLSFSFNITVNVSSGLFNGTVLTDSADAVFNDTTGTQFGASQNATNSTTVLGFPLATTSKVANQSVVVKGTQLNYTIVVNNTGDDTMFNLSVVDTYPSGVVFDSADPTPTGNNTWSFASLAPNGTATIYIRVNVSSALTNGTVLNNSYTATFANVSGQNSTVSNSTTTSVQGIPSLITNKTDTPDPVGRGNVLTYSIFINNTGDEIAYNVTVLETYPLSVTFNGSTPAPTSGNNTFSVGNLLPNQSTTITITVNVSSTAANGSVLNNSYDVTYTNISGSNVTVQNSTLTTVRGAATLTTSKTANSTFVVKGTQLNYTIVVNNTGDDTAFNTSIVETYPSGVVFDSSTPVPTSGNNTFSAGNLSPNATFTITVRINVSAGLANGTILNNSYTATFANFSGQNTTVTNSTTTSVLGYPAAATSKTANQSVVVKGASLNYTILVTNTGDDTMFNISVVDGYPLGVTFDSASPAPTGNNTWSFASLAPNASTTISIRVNVSSALTNGTVLNNSYNLTFANVSGQNTTVSNSTTTTVRGIPSIITNKTDSPDPVIRGKTLSYTILVNNTGDEVAYNVTVVEVYPASTAFNGSSPAPSAGNNTFSLGSLAPNQSTTLTITLNVSSAATNGSVLNNSYTLTFANISGVNATVSNSTTTIVQGIPNVITNKTDSPDPVVRGHTLNYTILVNNTGDEIAYNVTVVDAYPLGTTFSSGTPAPSAGNNTFSLGNLLPNASTTINITVTVNSTTGNGSVLNNTYTLTFANVSGVNATVSNSTTTIVQGIPNVITNKTDSPDPVVRGNALSYTILINNTGDEIAYNVTVVEAYPAEVSFTASSPAPSSGNDTFNLGNLLPNQSTTINITVTVGNNTANGSVLNNSYTLTFANVSGINDTASNSTQTTVRGIAIISTSKTASQTVITKGTQLNYTITLSNLGDDTAFNTSVVESYPAGVIFDSSTPSPISGNDTFNVSDIQPGTTVTLIIVVNVSTSVTNGTILNNSYTATFANLSGQNTTVTNSTTTTVLGYPTIDTSKTDSQDPVIAGSPFNYSISITNNGDDTAFNITVIETYPAGTTYLISTPLPSSGLNEFTVPDLAPGQTTTVDITVSVDSATPNGTVLNNTYTVTFANATGDNLTTSNSTNTTVLGLASLSITKTATPNPVIQGGQVTYQITISNTGSDTAYNVTAVETYPNVTFNNATPIPTSGNDTWAFGDLLPGQSANITITVNTSSTFTGQLNNTVTANFADTFGNPNTAATTQTTQVNAPAVSGGGGGGGGASSAIFSKTYDMTTDTLLTSQLKVTDKVKFFLNNIQHTLTVTGLSTADVTFSVASDPQTFTLSPQQYQLVDVEKDGINDLRVDAVSIAYPHVVLRLQKINSSASPFAAKSPSATGANTAAKQNSTAPQPLPIRQETPPARSRFLPHVPDFLLSRQPSKSNAAWYIAALAIAAILAGAFVVHRRKHSRHHAQHHAHHKKATHPNHPHSMPPVESGDKSEREQEFDRLSVRKKK